MEVSEKGVTVKPLSNFKRLSKVVRLYEPLDNRGPVPPDSPTTILICSWMNAIPKHAEYYTKKHMEIYPHARIIFVTITTKEFLMHSESQRRADIKEVITALLARNQSDERLLVHTLSNGGARRLYGIAGAYREATGKPLPVKAFIMDSAPGIPQFRRDIRALSVPGKKLPWLLWFPFMTAIVAVTTAVYITVNWMPKWFWSELVWRPMAAVNNIDFVHKNCVKGFVYSKEDNVIDWRHVEDHADIAEKKGYKVVKKRVEGAHHVQMFRGKGGEGDYWEFVERIWRMGMESGGLVE
ncbi:hypothetical protein BGZ60DRAFT_366294 [Tricladium varicosporioides]|nr:hypothetical protein BGZ60DRAFT_366294 [Hymenoscyphus varicosporioides]